MALNFYHKIGNLTIKRGDNEYNVGIWDGNCLAVFNAKYKDETGRDMSDFESWAIRKAFDIVYKYEKGNNWYWSDASLWIELDEYTECMSLTKNGILVCRRFDKDFEQTHMNRIKML